MLISVHQLKAQRFRGEIIGGLAASQVSGDELSGFNKAGPMGGGGVRYSWDDKNSLGFRILYIQKGSRKPSNLENGDPSFYLMRLQYIEVPVNLRWQLIKRFYAEAGFSLGYLFRSYEENENGELNDRNPFHTFDLSGVIALGYPVTKSIDFQFGYMQSLLPVREHGGNATYRLNFGQYNTVLTFGFVYTLQASSRE